MSADQWGSHWTLTKLGLSSERGVLRLGLFENGVVGPYTKYDLFIYPREGVTLGERNHNVRLVVLKIQASQEFMAKLEAERAADKWLKQNIAELCKGNPGKAELDR